MKKTLQLMLSTQALAFGYFRSMEDELARKRQLADYQRLGHEESLSRFLIILEKLAQVGLPNAHSQGMLSTCGGKQCH